MSLIKLSHVLLTHPQTPINRSLPKAFKGRSWRHQDILGEETKTPERGIIQIIFLDFKGHWNQAQKPPETSINHKSVKLNGFKPLKPRRTSTTNLRRRRTRITWRTKDSQQAYSQRFIVILFQRSSIHSSAKLNYIGCSDQNHITTNPINKSFKEIESEDNSFVITENCTTHSLIQICIYETILLVWLISNREI